MEETAARLAPKLQVEQVRNAHAMLPYNVEYLLPKRMAARWLQMKAVNASLRAFIADPGAHLVGNYSCVANDVSLQLEAVYTGHERGSCRLDGRAGAAVALRNQ